MNMQAFRDLAIGATVTYGDQTLGMLPLATLLAMVGAMFQIFTIIPVTDHAKILLYLRILTF
jgi:hypothetical protein